MTDFARAGSVSALLVLALLGGCGGDDDGGASPGQLVRVVDEPPGDNCAGGGSAIETGTDDNGDGVLDAGEVESTSYVCAGGGGSARDVGGFAAVAVRDEVFLSWDDLAIDGLASVVVRRATGGYPATAADGELVYDGDESAVTDSGLAIGTEYFYRAFGRDADGHLAPGVDARVTPLPAGSFDPSLNGSGFLTEPPIALYDRGSQVVTDGAGRIVVIGTEQDQALVIWRFLADGRPDPSWAGSGVLIEGRADSGYGVALDGEGRLLATGRLGDGMALFRYLDDGSSDGGFGTIGRVYVPGQGPGMRVAIDDSGRAVVLAGENSATVLRFTPEGDPDDSFGDGGAVALGDMPGGSTGVLPFGLALSGDEIVVVGSGVGVIDWDLAVWWLDEQGDPKSSFGGDGIVTIDAVGEGPDVYGFAVAIDSAGRVVIGGAAAPDEGVHATAWRFGATGALDSSFGDGGVAFADLPAGTSAEQALAVTIDDADRIVLAGQSFLTDRGGFALWRFTAAGTPDASFGDGGRVRDSVTGATDGSERIDALAIDGYGRIVAAGSVGPTSGSQMALWRLLP